MQVQPETNFQLYNWLMNRLAWRMVLYTRYPIVARARGLADAIAFFDDVLGFEINLLKSIFFLQFKGLNQNSKKSIVFE